jgi:hypothetical protein
MLFKEIVNFILSIIWNPTYSYSAEFSNVKAGGTYSYHSGLKRKIKKLVL